MRKTAHMTFPNPFFPLPQHLVWLSLSLPVIPVIHTHYLNRTHMRATSCPPSINRISHIMPSAFAVIGKVNPRCENDVWAALLRKRQSSRTSAGPRCAALSLWRTPLFSQKPFSPNRQDTPVLLICLNGLQAGVFQPFIGSIWAEALLETGPALGHYRLMSFQKQRLTVNAVNFGEFKAHYDKCCTAFVTQKKKSQDDAFCH